MKRTVSMTLVALLAGLALTACGDKDDKKPAAAAAPATAPATAPAAAPAATPAAPLAKDKNGCLAHPKDQWMSEADAQAKINDLGYKVKTFKVTGNCYEIYGFDKAGKKAEVYFDAKDLSIVKTGD